MAIMVRSGSGVFDNRKMGSCVLAASRLNRNLSWPFLKGLGEPFRENLAKDKENVTFDETAEHPKLHEEKTLNQ